MKTLPITPLIPEIREKLQQHNRVVLQAPPGAGKTTALPLALLNEPWLQGKKILMLEPRRLAVRTSAARMATLLGETVGHRIGYQIKMDSMQCRETQILIVTEGILTRKLQQDPSLESVGLIIFDEFHERSIHADLSLALALESQSILRDDLRLLVMSATLHTSAISALLGNAPLIESQGRAFPVERHYLEKNTPEPSRKEIPAYIHKLLMKILSEACGNILVFLPGIREIQAVETLLETTKPKDLFIAPLYGNLSKEAQESAIEVPPEGSRKVVLATNIAQTSLTIEGICIVIDSGLQNVSVFNPFSGMDRLESRFISKDAATQRAGRAGRLSAGKAYHLWHKSKILLAHDIPEILLTDLTPMVLELAYWGSEAITDLSWIDTPPPAAVTHARQLLVQLGALHTNGTITAHGKAMCTFGLHPRLAHMMLEAQRLDLSYEASLLAVLLTEKDIYLNQPKLADMGERVKILHNSAQKVLPSSPLVNVKQCHTLLAHAKRLETNQKREIKMAYLGLLLAFAYPDRIASLRERNSGNYLLANGKGAILHRDDTLYESPYLVVCDLNANSTHATIYKASALTQDQIERELDLETHQKVTWNRAAQRVEVRKRECLGALVIKEKQLDPDSNAALTEEVQRVLLEALKRVGLSALPWSKKALQLRERVLFLRLHQSDFPDFSDAFLLENMKVWLSPYLTGITSLKACQNLNLYAILNGLLSFEQTKRLDRLAPATLKVASGSNITIDYNNPEQPILAVRLQEMFGTSTTPTLLDGKIPLMLHLLSPASRPIQVTQDLESFWKNTYDEVKKELRGKYKKHYWPDNPLEAQATTRTKRQMQKEKT